MIKYKVKIPYRGGKVTLTGHGFKRYQMLKLAGIARDERVRSVQSGLGSEDERMKPLSIRYARFKSKIGKGSERNLTLSGKMLQNFQPRTVSEKQARIENSTRMERAKARGNERRTPWVRWSRRNVAKVVEAANKEFKGNVQDLKLRIRGQK